jgi:hypothetical protein
MKMLTDEDLTRLADAAFKQAAQVVIARAVASGTPLIVCVKGEIQAVDPRTFHKGTKRARRGRGKASSPSH